MVRRVIIMGAGGRDFHDFNVVFRDDPNTQVVAFTAAQIPGIDDRCYPAELAGPRYPDGIPIRPESELVELIRRGGVDEVILAYSDLAHEDVMHKASIVLAAGADFRLLGTRRTMLTSTRPVVAVSASRTGCGKSQTSRYLGRMLRAAGYHVVLVRHPMPYGDLASMRVQRFASIGDIDRAHPTVEEREEYELPVRDGLVVFAGVDYAAILHDAEAEAEVIIWDGGNNDLPFFRPDIHITVVDPLRPGHEMAYHPGETNVRCADAVVISKVDSARLDDVARVAANVAKLNPRAVVIRAASPVTLSDGPSLVGARVLVIEDGPSVTHGGLPFGAGSVAARHAGATTLVDPRPVAVGTIAATFDTYRHLGPILPAMGYGDEQLQELEKTIAATDCDVIVTGTPVDLTRLIHLDRPVRRAGYELQQIGTPTLEDVVLPRLRVLLDRVN
jgi:predicted GTPase